mmetsp:Transcript_23281/g.37402  ORF Transcript_23281/g.37402 Transcript_23281/m.37402 type:complete len:81 (+) Transcript_23281:774-1016(+)
MGQILQFYSTLLWLLPKDSTDSPRSTHDSNSNQPPPKSFTSISTILGFSFAIVEFSAVCFLQHLAVLRPQCRTQLPKRVP